MDLIFKDFLDFANRGLEEERYVYTQEICKNILNSYPDCIEARKILQAGSKKIYENKIFVNKVLAQIISVFYLLLSFVVCKWQKLKMLTEALCYYPKGKVGLILFAQGALDEDFLEVLVFAYEELNVLFPKEIAIGLALGNVYLSMGNYKSALEKGQEILEKDASNIEAMELMEQAVLMQMKVKFE